MAVLANESGMTSEESKQNTDSSHEFNLYADRQLQNKLLQAEEDLDNEEYENRLSNSKSGSNLKSAAKSAKLDSKVEDISGWFPDGKFVARRLEGAKSDPKSTKDTFIHPWRDYKSRREGSFVFKHYSDFKQYIEQYRNEHGCHNTRYPSGTQMGEMRRMAFQTSAPSQPAAVQVSMQQIQQGWNGSTPPSQAALHYTNRKEQMGTLITSNPNSNCSCGKGNHAHIDQSSHSHRYKLSLNNFSRTNTEIRSHPGDSDNSSESGDNRARTPTRRVSSATPRSRPMTKSPTKITVPANPVPRTYPIQALTIQQNGKTEVCPATKPLDNLNCVAPDKQEGSPISHSESNYGDCDDVISMDQLSTCPLSAEVRVRPSLDPQSSQVLQVFLSDPVLSQLNQRPLLMQKSQDKIRSALGTSNKLFSGESFADLQNDVDAMTRVNMWNPIISTPTPTRSREQGSQQYRNLMIQTPFRKNGSETKMPNNHEKQDYFNSAKNIKLSITRLNNAVSFCRTQVQPSKEGNTGKKNGFHSKKPNSTTSLKSRGEDSVINKSNKSETADPPMGRFKSPIYDHFQKSTKPSKFEKINIPLPQVEILESLPVVSRKPSNAQEFELPYVENKNINVIDMERFRKSPVGSAKSSNYTKTDKLSVENHDVYINMANFADDTYTNKIVQNGKATECESCQNSEQIKELEKNVRVEDDEHMLVMLRGVKINVDTEKCKPAAHENNPRDEMSKIDRKEQTGKTSNKIEKKPAVASGVVQFSSPTISPLIAKLTESKLLKVDPELDGLTWLEKLEILRSVNKPPPKPKPKRQKIKFVKDEPLDPVYLWTTEQEQLYEQRRIRHLVEQSRMKGVKQFDWVYEAQMRARGIDWDTGKLKVDSEHGSSGDSSQSDDSVTSENRKLRKYGINVPPNGAKQKLFNTHSIQRSNTYIVP